MPLEVQCHTVGPVQANCYSLVDADTAGAVLVDPGAEAPRLLAALSEQTAQLQAIWLTHAHFDHVGALADILEANPVPVYMHPSDEPLLAHAAASAAQWGIPLRQPPVDYRAIADGDTLTLGNLSAACLHTPGHAPGHIAFHLAELSTVFSGDALFHASIGRTDLPFGDHRQLIESIKSKLLTLPGATAVLPGHGPETTIEHEARTNAFLK